METIINFILDPANRFVVVVLGIPTLWTLIVIVSGIVGDIKRSRNDAKMRAWLATEEGKAWSHEQFWRSAEACHIMKQEEDRRIARIVRELERGY